MVPQLPASERFTVRTGDGVGLVVHRVRSGRANAPAVMLLHGMASNHTVFHFPGRSFAEWLAHQGFDCFLPDLRGHGDSERPRKDWWLDEYLFEDLPVLLEAVRAASGQLRVHWVGHSLGGLLLLCYGILNPGAAIASGVAIGAALDYRVGYTSFRHLLKVRVILERFSAIPYGTAVSLLSPFLGGRLTAGMDKLTAWPPNIEPEVFRRIQALGFDTVPMSLLASLSTLFGRRGLRTRDRTVHFLEKARRFSIPLQLIGGSRDLQIAANAVRQTANLIGGPAEVRIFGREHGEVEDYGHWDLVLGRRAPVEVWPSIVAWIRAAESQKWRQLA
jgi:pimeloyl-ACP methyl ester carboxylesterase